MSNKLPSIVIGLAIFILTVGALLFLNQSSKKTISPIENQTEASPNTQQTSDQKSLKDLMGMQNQECSFIDAQSKSEGKIYVGSGKFRGDFSSDVNGQVMQSHMISDGKDFYIWTNDQKQGLKMTIQNLEQPQTSADNNNIDINKKLDYKCSSWVVDSSVFTLPKDIKFMELPVMKIPTSATTSGTNGGGSMKTQQCAACESLSGDAKAECKKALSCS